MGNIEVPIAVPDIVNPVLKIADILSHWQYPVNQTHFSSSKLTTFASIKLGASFVQHLNL